jgi:hypothetical protein
MKTEVNNYNGIGFFGVLALVFVTLKLTGYVTWSWWWVLSPLWIPWLIFVTIVASVALLTLRK